MYIPRFLLVTFLLLFAPAQNKCELNAVAFPLNHQTQFGDGKPDANPLAAHSKDSIEFLDMRLSSPLHLLDTVRTRLY